MKKLLFALLLLLPAPAFAVKVTSGSFAAATVTGNQEIDTGVDSVLKAIRFYGTMQTATGLADVQSGFHGMAVSSTTRKVVAWASDDAAATTNTGKKSANLAICILSNGTPTVDGEADFVSFGTGANAGKFTVNWTDAPASAYLIYYEAYYGDALSNVNITEHTTGVGSGNKSETGVGFPPDFIFFMSSQQTALGIQSGANVGFGAVAAVGDCISQSVASPDADGAGGYPSDTYYGSAYRNLICLTAADAGGIIDSFLSFDADGFTRNRISNTVSNALVWCLSMRGGRYDVGTFDSPTAGGTPQDQTISTNFSANGVSFMGGGPTNTVNAFQNEAHLLFGFGFDSSSTIKERHAWNMVDNVRNPTVTGKGNSNTKCVFSGLPGSPPTVNGEADYKTQTASNFTITWTDLTAVAQRFLFTTFGSPLEECPSGPKSGGTTSPNQFTNPNNVFTSNNVYASEGTPAETMAVYDFGLAPISGNNIDGILVECEGLCTGAACDIGVDVRLSWNAGINWTAVKTINPDAVEGYDALGGATDTWGRSWTATELNNPNFRVGIKYANELNGTDGYNLDHVRVTVYCSAPGGAGNIRRQRFVRTFGGRR